MRNQVESVRAIILMDVEFDDLVCGKCKSVIYPDEVICPVCGVVNDVANAIPKREAEVFPSMAKGGKNG